MRQTRRLFEIVSPCPRRSRFALFGGSVGVLVTRRRPCESSSRCEAVSSANRFGPVVIESGRLELDRRDLLREMVRVRVVRV